MKYNVAERQWIAIYIAYILVKNVNYISNRFCASTHEAFIHTYIHMYIHLYIQLYTHKHMYMLMYIHPHIHMYIYMYIRPYTHLLMYINLYNTYTYIQM